MSGSPQGANRKCLWEWLSRLSGGCSRPWLLAGDFNAVLSSDEKSGGSSTRLGGVPYSVSLCLILGCRIWVLLAQNSHGTEGLSLNVLTMRFAMKAGSQIFQILKFTTSKS